MKGQAETPSAALYTLVVAVIIQLRYVSMSTAMELNVTVTPTDIRVYQGRDVVISCAIRNMDIHNQKRYWVHKPQPNSFNVVSNGSVVNAQYSNERFVVSEYRSALTPTDLNYYLTIGDLMPSDTGDYMCLVVDIRSQSTVGAETATVSLHDRPKSPSCSPNGTVSVMEGSLLNMSCSSETVASPGNMTLTWVPPIKTLTSWDGPQDSDWQVVGDGRNSVTKQLNLLVDSKFNNSKFVCATESDEASFLVYETCIIGLITVLAVPPGPMDISVNVRQLELPLRDGVLSGFTCDVVFTPPISAKDYIQRYWQTTPEVDFKRFFRPSNPIHRTIYIIVLVQDSGGVLECTVTFRGKVYVGNITLHVTHNASIPETTIAHPTAATNNASIHKTTIAYPTAATISVSTRTLPPISNLPWYTEPSFVAIIGGAAVVLLLLTLLLVCLTHHRRRKLNRNRFQEIPLRSEQDTGHPPMYLNSMPVTVFSENIYHEASDPTTEPSAAFGENTYHETTVDQTLPLSTFGGNIYHETADSTDPLSADGENVYHEATEVVVLPLNESQEELSLSESEQKSSECGSPVPELELYAETVENILYVPLDGYSTVVETQLK